jgi:hypothetical protein
VRLQLFDFLDVDQMLNRLGHFAPSFPTQLLVAKVLSTACFEKNDVDPSFSDLYLDEMV